MQKRTGLLVAILLALIAFYPALVHDGLPAGADLPLHYWKTFELENIWSRGDIYPRWAESFYYGYGAPTWQFTAAAPYAVAVVLGKLPLVDDVLRIKLVWGLSLLLSSVGVYHYAARRFGDRAALVAAAAFTFAPAILYIEPIGRASYPASFGLGCMAASLALLDDYAHTRRWWIGLLGIITLVGMLLSHNITAVTGAAVLFGWLVWQWAMQSIFREGIVGARHDVPLPKKCVKNTVVPYIGQAIVLFILACGLTGFFWIPVAFEQHFASIDILRTDPMLDFHIHFERLVSLLKPAARFDANMWNQLERWSLGIVVWPLALLGVVALFRRYKPHDPLFREMLFWLIVAVVSIFLVIPQSMFLWENLEILQTFQFPVRFLNIAALPLAIFAGLFAHILVGKSVGARHAVPLQHIWLVFIMALIAQGIRATPANWTTDYPAEATTGKYIQHEMDTGIMGTTAANEFLPAAVKTIPPPTGFVIDSLAEGGLVQRINTWTYPETVQFETLASNPTQYTFRVSSPDATFVELYLFYFPGWQATLDGEPVEMHLTGGFGFFGVYVPAGEHIIEITYPLTVPQKAGVSLSAVSVGLAAGWLWWQQRNHTIDVGARHVVPLPEQLTPRQTRQFLFMCGVVLMGMMALMREGIAWTASSPGSANLAARTIHADFDGAVQLLGYGVVKAPADEVWRVSLYWYFDPELAEDESLNASVHLVDEEGQIVTQSDKIAINHITQNAVWRDDMHLRDSYHLFLPDDLPKDELRLRVSVWRCVTGAIESCTPRHLPVRVGGEPRFENVVYLP